MPLTLGLDVGSSSVIAGILHGTRVVQESPRQFYASRHLGNRVEVQPEDILSAVAKTLSGLGKSAHKVDAIALAVMSPAWVAMDAKGQALTPIVTHQDRRSVEIAQGIEQRFGKARHLKITGCRPFPGGISSTTWAWYLQNEPKRLQRADLIGHLNTFLHRHMTGARVMDPSNASFTGLYETTKLGGWSKELCANIGANPALLPEIKDANVIAGYVTASAAKLFGLREGTPVMTGMVDGSAGMLFTGAKIGQLFNVCGSTDVLALCTDQPRPADRLLTRALGVDGKWLAVGTLAAVGSALYWARERFYPEFSKEQFVLEMFRLSKIGAKASAGVTFAPYMAGERTSIEQKKAGFSGLTLATKREHMLSAIIESLITASAERLPLLAATGTPFLPTVAVSGGSDHLDKLMRRDWTGQWKFRSAQEATMRGLGTLVAREA